MLTTRSVDGLCNPGPCLTAVDFVIWSSAGSTLGAGQAGRWQPESCVVGSDIQYVPAVYYQFRYIEASAPAFSMYSFQREEMPGPILDTNEQMWSRPDTLRTLTRSKPSSETCRLGNLSYHENESVETKNNLISVSRHVSDSPGRLTTGYGKVSRTHPRVLMHDMAVVESGNAQYLLTSQHCCGLVVKRCPGLQGEASIS